jgi:hypothetical protein
MRDDAMMTRIMMAIADKSDDRDGQRVRFQQLWDEIGELGDPLHRCTLAHYAADLEDDPSIALLWNQGRSTPSMSYPTNDCRRPSRHSRSPASCRRCI